MITAMAIVAPLLKPFEDVLLLLPDALNADCVAEEAEEDEDRVETADAEGVIVTIG